MTRKGAAALAGAAAGLVMSAAMMAHNVLQGRSLWAMPNLIAAMWMSDDVANGEMSIATAIGFLTHVVTSILMGVIAIPFIRDLPPRRTMLAALSYAVASYPVVFAGILSWANPLMAQRAELIPMTVGHAVFGVVLGVTFLRLESKGARGREVAR